MRTFFKQRIGDLGRWSFLNARLALRLKKFPFMLMLIALVTAANITGQKKRSPSAGNSNSKVANLTAQIVSGPGSQVDLYRGYTFVGKAIGGANPYTYRWSRKGTPCVIKDANTTSAKVEWNRQGTTTIIFSVTDGYGRIAKTSVTVKAQVANP
jgi:hypothetical protein